MAVKHHPCGCIFDDAFVDPKHHKGEQAHFLKGHAKKAEDEEFGPAETRESIITKVDKILSRKKGK